MKQRASFGSRLTLGATLAKLPGRSESSIPSVHPKHERIWTNFWRASRPRACYRLRRLREMSDTALMDRVVRRSLERRVPIGVHFDITYRCNERCVHCYLDHEDHGEMDTAEIKRVLQQLAEAGTLMLTFSGGEIFLRKDLFDLRAFARELHFDISLKSNALLVTRERAARLKSLGVRRIQISIYSADAAVHDAITKVRGSFERSIHAIRFLKSQGLQVKIACPLMKQNLSGLAQLRSLANELDVPYVIDMTITPKIDGDMGVLALRSSAEELLTVLQDPQLNAKDPKGGASTMNPRL